MIVKQWEIYLLNLNPVVGAEQGGTRPALVISSNDVNILNQVTIIPITSLKQKRKNIYPNEVLLQIAELGKDVGLDKDSIVLCHQMRAVDKTRLANKIGVLKSDIMKEAVYDAIKFQLGIEEY